MRFSAVPVALALSLIAPSALAQDPTRPSLGSGSYPAPTLHGELKLSLLDSIAMGLENNLGIEIERHDPLIAYEDSRAAWGAYDPEWTTEFGYADDSNPNANLLAFTDEVNQTVLGGFGGVRNLVPWLNTQVSTLLDTSKTETNIAFQSLSPQHETSLTVIARQPLMRNLIWSEPWTLVKTTKVSYLASLETFRRDVMDTVAAIEDSYWALIADEERVRVAEKSVETASALLGQVTTQYEVGVVSKVEIAEAEAGLADRDFNLIVAQNTYRNTMDLFIDLVLGPNLTADSRIQIEPTDRPDEFIPYDIDVQDAANVAFRRRPELAIAQKDIERLEINLRFRKNQRLPQLDVEGRWGHSGLSGQVNPASPNADPAFFGGWGKSFERQANSFEVRGIVSIPLGNISGRHNVSKAELELRRAYVQQRRVEQDIILEVRDAVRDISSAQEGIEAAQRGTVAASEQLRAERIRLEYGESTPFDVLQREEDLVRAESQEIGAFQTYRTAVTGLDRAQGTILRNRNVRIEEAARLR